MADCIFYCEGHFQCLLRQRAYDPGRSPLAVKCANDILCTRLLTLSPLAKVWMVISLPALTCDSTSTHPQTHTPGCWHTTYWLGWFVTSFPPLLPSHSYWFPLVSSHSSPSFSPSSYSVSLLSSLCLASLPFSSPSFPFCSATFLLSSS